MRLVQSLILVGTILTTASAINSSLSNCCFNNCDPTYTWNAGKCYKVIKKAMGFDDAENTCLAEGASLTVIRSNKQFLKDLIPIGFPAVWLAADEALIVDHKNRSHHSFRWHDGHNVGGDTAIPFYPGTNCTFNTNCLCHLMMLKRDDKSHLQFWGDDCYSHNYPLCVYKEPAVEPFTHIRSQC